MAGKLYEELLGIPSESLSDMMLDESPEGPGGYNLEIKRKRKIALLRKMLGEESGLDDVLQGARIVENRGGE